jgi:predicted nucleotidyltransferase
MILDRQRVRFLIDRAKATLEGEWLLIGGALLALTVDERRTTEDIDLIAMSDSNAQRQSLMKLADESGFPVESVNSAGDYFVRKIDGWRDELEVLETGANCVIFAPSPTLMLLLKIARLSEIDMEDCLSVVKIHGPRIDRARIAAALAAAHATASADRQQRLERLQAELSD